MGLEFACTTWLRITTYSLGAGMMKSLIALFQVVLNEMGTRCSTSTSRDAQTLSTRVEHEGLSFLTITLTDFCKDFEKSLSQEHVGNEQFLGFAKNSAGLPRFLGGFLSRVFDASDGRLLQDPCIDSIRAIRQLTLMFGKLEVECSPRRRAKAFSKYLECEQDVRRFDKMLATEPDRLRRFHRISRVLWAELLSNVDSRIYNDGVIPKHGPGATADKLRGNAKYNVALWTRRLEDVFPHWENLIPSTTLESLESLDRVTILEPGAEMPVKVISVPKTLKTPRIIAVEPTCMQYMQQGVLRVLVDEIARHNHARNFIMFESQEPNQRLAREGSLLGTLATLDLSEASDRVSNQHVRLLVSDHRFLREAVDATRSRKADVPGKGVIRLSKFASMGSALCFPFEALVFTTVVFMGIERVLNRPLTKKDLESFYGKVRVYGDDIIVPTDYVLPVIEELEAFGFRVNKHKSFWTGRFRESCGEEYYAGQSVKVARVRTFLPINRQHAREVISTVSLRNQFFGLDLHDAVYWLDAIVGKLIPFPFVHPTSPLLGRHDYSIPCQDTRHDPHLHLPLVKGVVVKSNLPTSRLDSYGALMKFFLKEGLAPFQDREHLERAGRPVSVYIKTRWAPLR
jgi:hypothetical protein